MDADKYGRQYNCPMQSSFLSSPHIKNGTRSAKPFLKWAGGKSQLIESLTRLFPPELQNGGITKYAEPFIGGGAIFFHIAQHYPSIEKFFISDINQELILTYTAIQKDVENIIAKLAALEKRYHGMAREAQKTFFYQERSEFNQKLHSMDFESYGDSWIDRAVTIIFLNRTCFNGLFRVNSRGEFNVPFGDYKNPKLIDASNLRVVAAILERTQIKLGNFEISRPFCDENTFVYFDPPYRPISKTASFTSYSKDDFGDESQRELAKYFAELSGRGSKLMLSNSDPKNEDPQDHFFADLYGEYHIERVDAHRMINCNGEKRGKIKELVITNY